jgi:hypothetical protein
MKGVIELEEDMYLTIDISKEAFAGDQCGGRECVKRDEASDLACRA